MKPSACIWIVVLALAGTLSACTKSEVGPPANRGPVDTQINIPEVKASSVDLAPVAHYEEFLDAKTVAWKKSFETIYTEVLQPLTAALLVPRTLEDRGYTGSTQFQSYLEVLHKAYLQLYRLDPSNVRLKQQFENYEVLVLKPCIEGRDTCKTLKLLARDRGYIFVVKALNEALKPDTVTAWKYLLYSLDFSQYPNSPEFSAYALNAGERYLDSLKDKDPAKTKTEVSDFLRVFNQIVLAGHSQAVAGFFDRIDIWSVDESGQLLPSDEEGVQRLRVRPVLRKALWPVLVGSYALIDGKPTRSFQKLIDAHLKELDAELMAPFRDAEKPSWNRVATSYGLKVHLSDFDPTYLALLDFAYTGGFNSSDILALLRKLHPGEDKILTVVDNYAQLRFTWMTMKTQEELAPLMGTVRDYISIAKLLQNLQRAEPLEEKWKHFQDQQMAALQLVVETYIAGLSADPETERIQKIFIRRDENIKRSVIYPNMLPLVYYVAQANLRDTLRYLWFTNTIDSDKIFEYLFNGQLSSWFNFTNVAIDRNLTGPEAIQAFHNAVLTETFPAYGIKTSDFLLQLVNRLTTKTVAALVTSSDGITRDFMADYENRTGNSFRSHFTKITDTCMGKANYPETIEIKDLGKNLHGHIADMLGNPVHFGAPVTPPYWFTLNPSGRNTDNMANLSDSLRTREMIYLDMIEEMVAMYKKYVKTYGLTEEAENLAKVDAELLKVHSAYRHFFGLVVQSMDRYNDCTLSIVKTQVQRQLKVMDYEQIYLKGIYQDLQVVNRDPSQLERINKTYEKTFPEIEGYKASERIEKIGNGYFFFYNMPDFLFRTRDYLKDGIVARDGKTYPPIAPNVEVTFPGDIMGDIIFKDSYRMFLANDRYTTLIYEPGMTEEQFIAQGFSQAFFNPGDNLEYTANTPERLAFGRWSEGGNAPRLLPIYLARVAMVAALIKSGPIEYYDFEKPGCTYQSGYDVLNQNCYAKREFKVDELIKAQSDIYDLVNITPEVESLLKKTKSSALWPRSYLKNVFISELNQGAIGMLDPVRFALSSESLGNNINYPGSNQENRKGIIERDGYLYYANVYHEAESAIGVPLIKPKDGLDGDIKQIYQTYVDREFNPLLELDKKVVEMRQSGYKKTLYYSIFTDPLVLPPTTEYSPEPGPMIQRFNSKTSFTFSHSAQQKAE